MEMASLVVFGVVLPLLCCEDVLFTQVTCGMGCFVLPSLSFRGELIFILGFRGGGFSQRLALRTVLPVAHVLQEVYEVLGFPRPKGYMTKYSIINDAPTRRSWSWKLGPFISAGSFYKSSMGHFLFEKALYRIAPYFVPFIANHHCFKLSV